jgi:hypothetical protein
MPIVVNCKLLSQNIDSFYILVNKTYNVFWKKVYNLIDKTGNGFLSKVCNSGDEIRKAFLAKVLPRLYLYKLLKIMKKYLSGGAHSKRTEKIYIKFHMKLLEIQRACYDDNMQRLRAHEQNLYLFLKEVLQEDKKDIDKMLKNDLLDDWEDVIKFACSFFGLLAGWCYPLPDALCAAKLLDISKKKLNSHSLQICFEVLSGFDTYFVNGVINGAFGKKMGEELGVILTELIKYFMKDCPDFKSSKYSYWDTCSIGDWLKIIPIAASVFGYVVAKYSMGYNNAPPGLSKDLSAILSAVGSLYVAPCMLSSGINAIRAIGNDILYKPYAVPTNIEDVKRILGFSKWWKFRCIRAAVKFDLSIYESLEKSIASIPDDELKRANLGKDFILGGEQVFFKHTINVDTREINNPNCSEEIKEIEIKEENTISYV